MIYTDDEFFEMLEVKRNKISETGPKYIKEVMARAQVSFDLTQQIIKNGNDLSALVRFHGYLKGWDGR